MAPFSYLTFPLLVHPSILVRNILLFVSIERLFVIIQLADSVLQIVRWSDDHTLQECSPQDPVPVSHYNGLPCHRVASLSLCKRKFHSLLTHYFPLITSHGDLVIPLLMAHSPCTFCIFTPHICNSLTPSVNYLVCISPRTFLTFFYDLLSALITCSD